MNCITGKITCRFYLNGWKTSRVLMGCLIALAGVVLFASVFAGVAGAGTLRVGIDPTDVRAEARWNLYEYNDGWWDDPNDPGDYDFLAGPFDHNHTEGDWHGWWYLSGRYMVVFEDVAGWDKPDPIINIRVNWNKSVAKTGIYTSTSPTTTTTTTTSTTSTTTTTSTTITTTTSSTSTTITTTTSSTTTTTTLPGSVCIDVSETPMDTQLQPAPASIVFVIDDSGSMDWEILIQSSDYSGLYGIWGYNWFGQRVLNYAGYLYDMSDNNSGYYYDDIKNHWKTQWSGYNRMFYDSNAIYTPWPTKGNASTTAPRSNPENSSPTLTLGSIFDAVGASGGIPAVDIRNAHYYTYYDSNEDDVLDAGETVYLVNFESGVRKFYEYTDDGDNLVEPGELVAVSESEVPAAVRPNVSSADLQNWANWFSYYRKRELSTKNAIANVIEGLSGVRVGFHGINWRISEPVRAVNLNMGGFLTDETSYLLNALYALNSSGGTPLRSGLQTVGDYFSGTAGYPYGSAPYYPEADGGACQQAFAVAVTDGYWNSDTYLNVGNQDGGLGNPYQDGVSNTLADVAMKYYKNDISGLEDLVPTNFPDTATWQHMVTYGVSFGVTGTKNPDDYDFYKTPADTITWPTPSADGPTTIDDLWHATVNGRGQFLSASNPEELTSSLLLLMQNIESRIGSGASVSINGEEISAESIVFQSSYKSDDWTGDVKAYRIDTSSGAVISDTYVWSAQGKLQSRSWDTGRSIGSYNGTAGVAFRFGDLSETQKTQLYESQVNYIRGDDSGEGTAFRERNYMLGDIVHSIPIFYKDYIYAGGNDGMLHAFDASNGEEVFAYVPNLVFPTLYNLTLSAYNHNYFVDKSPYVKDTGTEELLVCGLGAGGKGYFCLDVTDPPSNTEANVSSWVKWEFEDALDLGYTFSRAFIVNSNDGWVVIFGNGYNSASGDGVLFIVNASTGSLIKKINVGGTCNGLSTPAIIDVNNDDIVDYAYAGDLNGNMWKFDLTGGSSGTWDVAYKDGTTPKPLFTAKDSSGTRQPITIKPDVMRHCGKNGYMVLFGTGQYLGDPDFIDTNTQTIYGIWDYGDDEDDSEYLGEFNRVSVPQLSNQPDTVSLLEQTQIFFGQDPGGSTTYDLRVLSDNQPAWVTVADINGTGDGQDPSNIGGTPNNAGWYFDLPISKERVIRNVIVRDGKLIVVSSIPKSSPCAAGGDSILHEMDACSGGRLTEAQFDINDDGIIDDNDLITITIDDPDNPGNTITITVAPTGIKYPAMIYEPIILRDNQREMKYFSTAAGNIIMLRERSEKRGASYWREMN